MNEDLLRRRTMKTVFRRLMPLLILMYVVACIDKANLSYAALQMNDDVGLTPSVFGLGAGLYFIVYTALEVPSNLLLHRIGARRWLARIMLSWGIVASLMAAIEGPRSFYAMRMLLGAAEAGFYPGVLFYLTLWFPHRERARAMAWFTCGLPIALVLGGLLSTALLSLDGVFSLRGWQWMFIVEGLPAIGLSLYVLLQLPDGPHAVSWLSAEQREWLRDTLANEAGGMVTDTATASSEQDARSALHAGKAPHAAHRVLPALCDRRVLLFSLALFCMMMGNLGLSLWLPQIVKQVSGYGIVSTGLLSVIPYFFATVSMVCNAGHAERTGERRRHTAVPALIGAAALIVSAYTHTPVVALIAVTIAASGILSAISIFFSMPAALFTGASAAAAIALVNCLGNIGGFAGPYVIGITRELTGSFSDSLLILAGFLAAGAGMVLAYRPRQIASRPVLDRHRDINKS